MATLIQSNFSKGEVSPTIYGRVDVPAYKSALATARNAVVHSYGGASNRPGTVFIGPVKDHTYAPRLIPFQFSTTDAYMLEFGNLYMRVIRNNAYVTEATKTITGITAANPAVVTSNTHGYSDGDDVFITGVLGMLEVNNRTYTVSNKTANTYELTDQADGTNIDASGFTAYSSGGTSGKIFELVTLYATADLFEINFTQTANIMTLVHPTYPVQELTRTAHNAWTITEPAFQPNQDHPTGATLTVNTAGTETDRYKVTAIADDGEESLSALNNTTETITGATVANPVVVTIGAGHTYVDGDEIEINSVVGMTELNGRRFLVNNSATPALDLQTLDGIDLDGSGFTAYSSGGTSNLTFVRTALGAVTRDNTIAWTAVTGANKYAIYLEDNGLFGLIGETVLTTFDDENIAADTIFNPPKYIEVFFVAGEYPGAVGHYEQRLALGGANSAPDTITYSKTGLSSNFTHSVPRVDDDAITATLTSKQVNQVRHLVPMNDLIALTSGSEWAINSGPDSGFSATTLTQREQSTWGCSHRPPLVLGSTVLFVQTNNAIVRSLGFSFQVDAWVGSNVGLLADHLLRSNTISDWALVKFPDPVIYMVRDDGELLSLTYDKDNEVIAWTTWDTDGNYEAIASLRTSLSAEEETPYFVVKRTINGNTVRYVEYGHTRNFSDVRDTFFVDSGLSLDNPVTITGATAADPVVVTATAHGFTDGDDVDIFDILWEPTFDSVRNATQPAQLNTKRWRVASKTANTFEVVSNTNGVTITGATQANPIVVTSAAHGFSNGDVVGIFDVAGMIELNGSTYKISSATTDTYELTDLADVDIDSSGFTAYTTGGQTFHAEDGSAYSTYVSGGTVREVIDVLYGLSHLIGENVMILQDGNVVSSLSVASDGSLTLSNSASRVHVGLRYVSDFETLDIDGADDRQSIQGKIKKIGKVNLKFERTRGLLIGPDTDNLSEMKQREFELMGDPTALLSGDYEQVLLPDWNSNGRVFIRQINPLPVTILAIIPEVEVSD